MTIEQVDKWLKANKRNLVWLASESGINYNTLRACMKGLFKFSKANVLKLKKVIK